MPNFTGVTALLGGQFGSEGKGKIAAYLAPEFDMSIRTGGPNAGHTVEYLGKIYKLQSIPCAFVNSKCILAIGAGGLIDLEILAREIKDCSVTTTQLVIDPQAGIIDPNHASVEAELKERIGSTGKGVGAAIAAKSLRDSSFRLARDVEALHPYLGDVALRANEILDKGGKVCLEGTQGLGLSLHHGIYPYVTSRDTTVGTLCGDAGVSPRLLSDVILVVRTYPIRVAGNSGPLHDEIDWAIVTSESSSPEALLEITTVSKKVRRVGRFDLKLVQRAILLNRPTQIALTFVDYLDFANKGAQTLEGLTPTTRDFIESLEMATKVPVTLIGTGPNNADIIDLRKQKLP